MSVSPFQFPSNLGVVEKTWQNLCNKMTEIYIYNYEIFWNTQNNKRNHYKKSMIWKIITSSLRVTNRMQFFRCPWSSNSFYLIKASLKNSGRNNEVEITSRQQNNSVAGEVIKRNQWLCSYEFTWFYLRSIPRWKLRKHLFFFWWLYLRSLLIFLLENIS